MGLVRRSARRRASTAWVVAGAAGLGGAAAILYLLEPGRRRRAGRALREVRGRAAAGASGLGGRAATAVRRRLTDRARQPSAHAHAHAHAAGSQAQARARTRRAALTPASVRRDDRTPQATAAAVLIARAVLGSGLLRIPSGLLGASLLVRLASDSLLARRVARAAREAAERLRLWRQRFDRPEGPAGVEPGVDANSQAFQDRKEEGSAHAVSAPEEPAALVATPDASLPEADAAERREPTVHGD